MSPETALKLAEDEIGYDASPSKKLRVAKEIFDNNKLKDRFVSFTVSDQDINFLEIFEILDVSERERDIIYISNFYHRCYFEYNITLNIMNEDLSPVSINQLIEMYDRLEKYNLLKFLFAGEIVPREEFVMQINS